MNARRILLLAWLAMPVAARAAEEWDEPHPRLEPQLVATDDPGLNRRPPSPRPARRMPRLARVTTTAAR
jgi:hypothetical protein